MFSKQNKYTLCEILKGIFLKLINTKTDSRIRRANIVDFLRRVKYLSHLDRSPTRVREGSQPVFHRSRSRLNIPRGRTCWRVYSTRMIIICNTLTLGKRIKNLTVQYSKPLPSCHGLPLLYRG